MIPTTARSSTRVKAALLRSVSVNLAEIRRVLMCEGLNVRNPDWVGAGCECCFEETVVGWATLAIREITIKAYTTLIYIVNTGLKSKYSKINLYT
jgi:hypothetical protein